MTRVAFVGCRDWEDVHAVRLAIVQEASRTSWLLTIVTGCATGADALARSLAAEADLPLTVHTADWERFGKRAGPERNARIVADAERMVAFWDGTSPGTRDAITQMVKAGKPVQIVPKGERR